MSYLSKVCPCRLPDRCQHPWYFEMQHGDRHVRESIPILTWHMVGLVMAQQDLAPVVMRIVDRVRAGLAPSIGAELLREFLIDELYQHEKPCTSVVYFITDGRAIKIGWTATLERRLKWLQAANATELSVLVTMPGTAQTEDFLHRQFFDDRLHGEWFDRSPRLLEFIDLLRAEPVVLPRAVRIAPTTRLVEDPYTR